LLSRNPRFRLPQDLPEAWFVFDRARPGIILRVRLLRHLDDTDNGLASSFDAELFHGHVGMTPPATAVEYAELTKVQGQQLIRVSQSGLTTLEGLIRDGRASQALHRRGVRRDDLHCEHPLELICRIDALQCAMAARTAMSCSSLFMFAGNQRLCCTSRSSWRLRSTFSVPVAAFAVAHPTATSAGLVVMVCLELKERFS